MQTREVRLFSGGLRLDGMIQSPDAAKADERRAVVLVCSGLHGLKEWVPARWWPQIVEAGYRCFAFDYRGFGSSEGERGRIIPSDEIADVRAAITFLQQQPEIDPERIALIGWGLGGGIVIATAHAPDGASLDLQAAPRRSGARTRRGAIGVVDRSSRGPGLRDALICEPLRTPVGRYALAGGGSSTRPDRNRR